ncbi:hypothetical protein RYX36_010788 [Vicia faba]
MGVVGGVVVYGLNTLSPQDAAVKLHNYVAGASSILPPGGEEFKGDESNRIFKFKISLGHDDPDAADMHRSICVMC